MAAKKKSCSEIVKRGQVALNDACRVISVSEEDIEKYNK